MPDTPVYDIILGLRDILAKINPETKGALRAKLEKE